MGVQADTLGLQARTMSSHATADFDDFYRANRAAAVRWATALVGSRAIGEEIAQEALLAVGRKLASVERPEAYLRRAVVHRAASWHRWHGRSVQREAKATAGQPASYTEPTRELLDALTSLPYQQRAAVTLRYWADWTDDQIAEALGCAPATVRVWLHRGIAALRKEIDE